MATLVCVPIMVRDPDDALALAARAKAAGADVVEYRLDELFSGDEHEIAQAEHLVARSPLPCIATCRPTWEGGACDADDMARVALFERLGTDDHPPRFLDVELAAYTRSANLKRKVNLAVDHPDQIRDLNTSLVLSAHDFDGRPADLSRRVLAMANEPAASVHKIAFHARSIRDNLELFDLLRERSKPMIALGMGEMGLMSRVLAPKFGAFLTFASLDPAEGTAPGQPTINDLLDRYRFRSIGPETRVYGVVGWPVAHSRSPEVHNAGFEAAGFDGVYLPMPVPVPDDPDAPGVDESFKATLLAMIGHRHLDLAGLSVTIPHKQRLVRLAREQGWTLDPIADACGAANTLTITHARGQTTVAGRNTDASAVVDALRVSNGKTVLLLGAGGVARGAAAGLLHVGARVRVWNRTAERASEMADSMRAHGDIEPVAEPTGFAVDAIVNATSLGMSGGPDPDGLPGGEGVLDALAQDGVVLDTVYTPPTTPLLREARSRGLRTVDGVEVFVRQAEAQFEGWTGSPPEPGLFRAVLTREHNQA